MVTEQEKAENKAKMDAAAVEARKDFEDEIVLKKGSWKDVVRWAARHKATAGYKRLAKILVDIADTVDDN